MISSAKIAVNSAETSDSFDRDSCIYFRATKRPRHDHHENTAAKFKGVVPQQNGHWGAQIYANHQRIWLGTFKSEHEAATAYDSAAVKLRSGDSYRNFPWTEHTIQEPNFQTQFTTEAILTMIRDGSYQPKFADFLRTQTQKTHQEPGGTIYQTRGVHNDHGPQFSCMQLFQKELTPSDVGKLNRLVIPKKFAVKYFPYISETEDKQENGAGSDMELVFYDRLMKTWKFRYSYWRSSQSFVFTRGWNRFVKEKNLKEKDIVSFYTCVFPEVVEDGSFNFCLIDVIPSNGGGQSCGVSGFKQIEEMQREIGMKLKESIRNKMKKNGTDSIAAERNGKEQKVLRLFGVRIN